MLLDLPALVLVEVSTFHAGLVGVHGNVGPDPMFAGSWIHFVLFANAVFDIDTVGLGNGCLTCYSHFDYMESRLCL